MDLGEMQQLTSSLSPRSVFNKPTWCFGWNLSFFFPATSPQGNSSPHDPRAGPHRVACAGADERPQRTAAAPPTPSGSPPRTVASAQPWNCSRCTGFMAKTREHINSNTRKVLVVGDRPVAQGPLSAAIFWPRSWLRAGTAQILSNFDLAQTRRTLMLPRRTLMLPRRTLIVPRRTLMVPRRTLMVPRRTLMLPRRIFDAA